MNHRTGRWLAATGFVAAGALLVACGSSGDSASPATTTQAAATTTSASAAPGPSGGTSAESAALIQAAVDGGDPVVCDMQMSDGGTGVAYIRGLDSLRADIDDVEIGEMTMLLSGGEVYVWAPQDTRSVAFGPAMSEELEMMPEVEDLIDGDNSVLDCQVYDGDTGVFAVPGDIEFTIVDDDMAMGLWLVDDLQSDDPSTFGQFSYAQMTPAEQAEVAQLTEMLAEMTPAEREELFGSGN